MKLVTLHQVLPDGSVTVREINPEYLKDLLPHGPGGRLTVIEADGTHFEVTETLEEINILLDNIHD